MKFALILTHAGAPGTLATTSLMTALAQGLGAVGAPAHVFVLTRQADAWRKEMVGRVPASAPWLGVEPPTFQDAVHAAQRGLLSTSWTPSGSPPIPDWHLELLLERELRRFAQRGGLTLIVHPRSAWLLKMLLGIADRHRWRVLVFSNEALTDLQIDSAVRDEYIALVSQATGVWAVSEYLSRFWRERGVQPARVLIRPGVVSSAVFEASADPHPHAAMYIGNLQHREIDYLIEIANVVAQHDDRFRLDIYGDSTPERRTQLSAEIEAMRLSGVVTLHAAVPPAEVPSLLARASVLLLPRARGEFSAAGFPQKLGEYLAVGRPVVVTRVGDIPTYLTDGENAFLVEPDDPDGFVQAVERALSNADSAAAVGAAGKRVAQHLLEAPLVAAALVEFAQGLKTGSRRRQAGLFVRLRAMVRVATDASKPSRYAISHALTYTKSGHTRIVAAKMAIVRIFRTLHLRPPSPPR